MSSFAAGISLKRMRRNMRRNMKPVAKGSSELGSKAESTKGGIRNHMTPADAKSGANT